jgi:predicted transcriptional regulator
VIQFYSSFRACVTLAEHDQMRSERVRYSRRSLQSGEILTVEEGRHIVCQSDDEHAKAERLRKRLEGKDSKVGRCRC